MKTRGLFFYGTVLTALIFLTGCTITCQKVDSFKTKCGEPLSPIPIVASYTKTPIVIDGLLDDPVWEKALVYQLGLSTDYELPLSQRSDKRPGTNILQEGGEVQLAWDKEYLYVGIKFYDSDIVQENEEDQQHHYGSGDLVEIFLKPEQNTWYWEIYGTPNEKKTVFWFPGRGRQGLVSGYEPGINLEDVIIATKIEGRLNDWRDKDSYWTAEMAIPIAGLTTHGDSFGPGSEWRILIARYNYSRFLPWKELSMFPRMSMTNFHLLEDYGLLEFEE